MYLTIRQLYSDTDPSGQEISVGGWVRTVRDSKTLCFIELNDGTFFKGVQVVVTEEECPDFLIAAELNVGSAIVVSGTLEPTPEAKQPFEIRARKITLEGAAPPEYPLQKKRHTLEYLRTIAHLRPRTNTFNAVFRVRSEAAYAIHSFFNQRGFVYVHKTIITGRD